MFSRRLPCLNQGHNSELLPLLPNQANLSGDYSLVDTKLFNYVLLNLLQPQVSYEQKLYHIPVVEINSPNPRK